MTSRPAASSAIPIVVTLFAVAFGVFVFMVAGRDPFLLYLISTPFVVIISWLARGVGEEHAPVAHKAVLRAEPEHDAHALPGKA